MPNERQIKESKSIHRQTGKTFYVATRFLPERVRRATYVLYAFFRLADEVVDGEQSRRLSAEAQAERLETFRAQALGEVEADDPVLDAFDDIREEYDIDDQEVDEFIDAMKTDIETRRYETYADLEAYMRGSAAAVGVMMTDIMRPDDPDAALSHAIKLGEAFQLTNFLRDVREDVVDRDRIYLPLESLDRHGVTEEQVTSFAFDDAFAAVMQDELRRAERLYREGVAGIKYLPSDCQFPVLLAAVLYAEHHRLVRDQGYDVLTEEPSLSLARKLKLAAQTRWHWLWNKDPEAVFRRVSAVPDAERVHRDREAGEPIPMR